MKILSYGKDGGPDSTVWGYWLIEWKRLFSVALLCFEDGSRDVHHSHAFNSVSWVLSGKLLEHHKHGPAYSWRPSFIPVWTRRETFHRVVSVGRTWVLTFRGPWAETWQEWHPDKGVYTLTDGREIVP